VENWFGAHCQGGDALFYHLPARHQTYDSTDITGKDAFPGYIKAKDVRTLSSVQNNNRSQPLDPQALKRDPL
jgi:hypothetical protein